jgi:cAMP-dependent protein kinase regulator
MTDAEGVQQELQDYLQKKGINTLFINLVESLLLAKPENPISHIIQYLQVNFPEQATPRKVSAAIKAKSSSSITKTQDVPSKSFIILPTIKKKKND